MALNFPQNPGIGTVYTASNGASYTYDGVRWRVGAAARTVIKDVSYSLDAGNSRSGYQLSTGNGVRINALTSSVGYSYTTMTETPTELMSSVWSGDRDDSFVPDIELPFDVTFLGSTYNSTEFWVSSNSWIAFGADQNWDYSPYFNDDNETNIEGNFDIPSAGFVFDPTDMNGDTVGIPFLAIASYDNSVQEVYTLTTGSIGSRTFILRWSGNGDYDNETNHPIVWEVRFYENNPGIIDLMVIEDSRGNGNGAYGVSDSTQWLGGRDPKAAFPVGIGDYQVLADSGLLNLLWDGGTASVAATEYDLNLDGGSSNSRYLITDLDGGGA